MSVVTISRRGVERLRAGHPWIYRSDIADAEAAPGDLVDVRTERGRPVGWAFFSSTSQIALRMVASPSAEPLDEVRLFRERLTDAIAYRAALDPDATAWRLVHGEADRLPGLVVDRYDQYLVIQTLTQSMERRLTLIVDLLVTLLQPLGILARNDPKIRALEGLESQVAIVYGEIPPAVDIREGAFTVSVDLRQGQKTGAFLDQRENRLAAARIATGRGLDAFAYHGGFAMALASGCTSVLALDASASAVEAARANAARNGLTNVDVREANVFDELRELEIAGQAFETIVLDPPAFAKNRAAVDRAVAGYKEINLRAFKLLRPGGRLVTCSCSYNISEALFIDVVSDAARDARATVLLEEKRMQARDHPVLLNVPETHYLKCLILRKVA